MRKVTMVVAVLMMSCHVSRLRTMKYDGAQISTSSTHIAKNHGREKNLAAPWANRSNTDTSGLTSDGMCGARRLVDTLMARPYPVYLTRNRNRQAPIE
jgi:hypothetical protein